jgi:hypothetical protein
MLTWQMAPFDRNGNPEAIVGWVVTLVVMVVVAWYDCGEPGLPALCPLYATTPRLDYALYEPGDELALLLPDPEPGELHIWRPEQIDEAGNRSDAPEGGP